VKPKGKSLQIRAKQSPGFGSGGHIIALCENFNHPTLIEVKGFNALDDT
jgi:hypothetical protein